MIIPNDAGEEFNQLRFIQQTIGSQTTTHIDSKRSYCLNRLADVVAIQSAREKDRNGQEFSYLPAQAPVMRATGAAKFLDGQLLITRVEQDCINRRHKRDCLCDGFRAGHVNYLHQRNSRQLLAQICVAANCEAIANLNRIHSQSSLLLDDRCDILLRGKQK